MYHIAVLTKSETQETFYREQLSRFCAERGLFPRVDCYRGQEVFFEVARRNAPTNAVISLPGVDGLNAVEHLRALFPETRIIWCSELDFSLHAFRLRVDYFLLEPITEEAFRHGLYAWVEENNHLLRPERITTNTARRITDEKEKPDLYCRQLPAGRSIDPVDGSLQRSTGTGGGHADAFRHCNTGCHSRTCRGNDPFRAGIRRTPREGLAAQAGRGKPLHGKE